MQTNSAPTNAVRKGNYTQISTKTVEVSSTNQAVNGVADAQTVAKQVAYKLSEMKRDMEKMLLDNVAASAVQRQQHVKQRVYLRS